MSLPALPIRSSSASLRLAIRCSQLRSRNQAHLSAAAASDARVALSRLPLDIEPPPPSALAFLPITTLITNSHCSASLSSPRSAQGEAELRLLSTSRSHITPRSSSSMPPSSTPQTLITYSHVDGELRIILGTRLPPALQRKVIPALGACPQDTPLWPFPTASDYDRRNLPPLTLRFQATSEQDFAGLLGRQDVIRQQIWRDIGEHMSQHGYEEDLPAILFDHDPLDPGKAHGVIDIIFQSPGVFTSVRSYLRCIKIEEQGEEPRVLPCTAWSNTLPPSVVSIDILRLSLATLDAKQVLNSLNVMLAPVGSITGLAKFEVTTTTDGRSSPDTQITRAYLKLTPASMALDFASLLERIPTHFRFKGFAYTLCFAGRSLKTAVQHSIDFPSEGGEGEEEDATLLSASSSCTLASCGSSRRSSTGSERSTAVEEANKRRRR